MYLEETQSNNIDGMSKYKGIVESRIDRLDDVNISEKHSLKPGTALPKNGACKHNQNLFWWSRYVCWGKLFPWSKRLNN